MNLIMTPQCVYIYMIIYDHIYMYNMEKLIMSSFYNIYIYIHIFGWWFGTFFIFPFS